MFYKGYVKPNQSPIYQNARSPYCFDSVTSLPPNDYALSNAANGSSTRGMEHKNIILMQQL